MQYLKPKLNLVNLDVIDIITQSVTEEDNATDKTETSITTPESWG